MHPQRIPIELPKNSDIIPEKSRYNLQRIGKEFPKNSDRILKEFQ
jgi:hypothetical protein